MKTVETFEIKEMGSTTIWVDIKDCEPYGCLPKHSSFSLDDIRELNIKNKTEYWITLNKTEGFHGHILYCHIKVSKEDWNEINKLHYENLLNRTAEIIREEVTIDNPFYGMEI